MKAIFKLLALLFTLGLISNSWAANAPTTCTIKSYDGHYLTAIDGGGRTENVLATDRTVWRSWERFTLVDLGEGSSIFAIKTYSGYYLTAWRGGGRIHNVIYSNRTQVSAWEKFRILHQFGNWYAIQTYSGFYLTAVGGGGRTTDVIHSDATRIGTWELWSFKCGI